MHLASTHVAISTVHIGWTCPRLKTAFKHFSHTYHPCSAALGGAAMDLLLAFFLGFEARDSPAILGAGHHCEVSVFMLQ